MLSSVEADVGLKLRETNTLRQSTDNLRYGELRHIDMLKTKGCTDLKMKRQIDP
jgi:hypothetical protein